MHEEIEDRFKELLAPAIPFAVIDWQDDRDHDPRLDPLTFVLHHSQIVIGLVTTIDARGGRHVKLPPGVKWQVLP